MNFTKFNFHEDLSEGLEAMGYKEPTPVQAKAIPIIQKGLDIIACAQTGTGKTAAYILPILDKILKGDKEKGEVNTLIVVPTRELAIQIDQQFEGFSYFCPISSIAVYGGNDGTIWQQQKNALTSGADVIITTPGRLIAHHKLGYVKLKKVKHLILDEADRMLDMGFQDELNKIIEMLPKERQTMLFSATMPDKIRELAKKNLKFPEEVNIAISKPAEGILQAAYMLYDSQKIPFLTDLLKGKKDTSVIIFTSTKNKVKEIVINLKRNGIEAAGIHSDLEQKQREEVLNNFKIKKLKILVATNIVSRGIDIDNISLIINYDVPSDEEEYIHRIGRTARADTTGVAISLISDKEQNNFAQIEKMLGYEVHKVPTKEEIGKTPVYNPKLKNNSKKKRYNNKNKIKKKR